MGWLFGAPPTEDDDGEEQEVPSLPPALPPPPPLPPAATTCRQVPAVKRARPVRRRRRPLLARAAVISAILFAANALALLGLHRHRARRLDAVPPRAAVAIAATAPATVWPAPPTETTAREPGLMSMMETEPRQVATAREEPAGSSPSTPAARRRRSPPRAARPIAFARAADPIAAAPARADQTGQLVIATEPWCEVRVDGELRGTTPLVLTLPASPHVLLLENPEVGVRRRVPIDIGAGETVRLKLDIGRGVR
jgi:hypothetical protein